MYRSYRRYLTYRTCRTYRRVILFMGCPVGHIGHKGHIGGLFYFPVVFQLRWRACARPPLSSITPEEPEGRRADGSAAFPSRPTQANATDPVSHRARARARVCLRHGSAKLLPLFILLI